MASDLVQQPAAPHITCDQALKIAQTDALVAYRDLSPFRVSLFLEQDKWYVDYDLTKPGWAGGCPHYVIDAKTGTILSKRYEQ